jgi:hypothetical protein
MGEYSTVELVRKWDLLCAMGTKIGNNSTLSDDAFSNI